mgnify:CR=1 FL=1
MGRRAAPAAAAQPSSRPFGVHAAVVAAALGVLVRLNTLSGWRTQKKKNRKRRRRRRREREREREREGEGEGEK